MRRRKNIAIILAAGNGLRFDKDSPKIFAKIAGKKIITWTLERFEKHHKIDGIILVVRQNLIEKCQRLIKGKGLKKVLRIIAGGRTRQESARKGLEASADYDPDNLLFHDGVRPFVSQKIISEVIKKLDHYTAVSVVLPSPDTLVIAEKGIIKKIPERSYLFREQTPQAFHYEIIKKAHRKALERGIKAVSDDARLILEFGLADIYLIKGEEKNIKITYPLDIQIGEAILKKRE
jgi:ribitol-5-phosphate 2-dehydrogenase (NADP+) / D-ribitol-5-phosphate cytidylyltransferase